MRTTVSCMAMAAVALLGDRPAAAERIGVRLEWSGGCIAEAQLVDRVGRELSVHRIDSSAPVLVRGSAERDGETWRIHFAVIGADGDAIGERELSLAEGDCAVVVRHAELLAVMLVDSALVESASERAPPATRSAVRGTPAADPEMPDLLTRRPEPGGRARATFPIALGAVAEFGRLPEAPLGGAFEVSIALGTWQLGGRGLWFDAGTIRRGAGESSITWRSMELQGCRASVGRPIALDLCAGVGPGWVRSSGRGFVENRSTVEPTVDAVLAARLRLALIFGFEAALRADLRLGILRPEVGFEDVDGSFAELYVPGIAATTLGLSVIRRFP